eukprot:8372572-Pyramimonas_sp.AAC.1
MRNLGHELSRGRVRRVQERKRLSAFMAKRTKLQALVRGAKEKVRTLWRTGLLPSAAHGAGVSGVTDATLNKLRSAAATLVGA